MNVVDLDGWVAVKLRNMHCEKEGKKGKSKQKGFRPMRN